MTQLLLSLKEKMQQPENVSNEEMQKLLEVEFEQAIGNI